MHQGKKKMHLHFQMSKFFFGILNIELRKIIFFSYNFRFVYPTMDELAAQLLFVLSHFGLKSIIGFGVGAGSNILSRFAMQQPDKVPIKCLSFSLELKSSSFVSLSLFGMKVNSLSRIFLSQIFKSNLFFSLSLSLD